MSATLVPQELLQKPGKILFIAHLALGDFTYMQNCFQAFAKAFPHLETHLWVDEVRRTSDASQWKHLKKYSLYDWVAACPFFKKIYNETYSPELYARSIEEARRESYPIVVSLATLRPHQYAALAREVGPHAFVAGMKEKVRFYQPHRHLAYRRLDAAVQRRPSPDGHVSGEYADWFGQLFGIDIPPAARFPFVHIPEEWMKESQDRLVQWGFAPRSGKLVFINPFAKTKKRCWPLDRVAELIVAMQDRPEWQDACFIVNAVPQELEHAKKTFASHALKRTQLFSAEDNFFQLPAMLSQCDLIISVETAVMHLANAVHVPVIALMRQKNPEWVPIDSQNSTVITAARRRDWVDAITVDQVMKSIQS
jgi:ADP-heptose:LPS heptosyltransferase